MTPTESSKPVRIAIIGQTALRPEGAADRSGALAVALRQYPGVEVTLRAIAADESARDTIDNVLAIHGIASQVSVRDDGDPAPIRLGDTLDIWSLFAHDLVILDADDAPLRAFLTDLPAHTAPGVRILGTLDYAAGDVTARERSRDIVLRFDAIAGTVGQARALFGLNARTDAEDIVHAIGTMMRGANLRAVAIHDRQKLAIAALDEPAATIVVPASASREQVIAAIAVTMARRHRWIETADLLVPSTDA
ncbi:MAG: hypothetical protein QM589_10240 [Thermomicrobiales bacterium]